MKYTKEERLEIGRRIYEGELNRYQAAAEYGIFRTRFPGGSICSDRQKRHRRQLRFKRVRCADSHFGIGRKIRHRRGSADFSSSVDTALLEKEPEITRRSKVFLNSEELVRDLTKGDLPDRVGQTAFLLANASLAAERLHTLEAAALNAAYKYTPDELIAKMRARNVALSLWTLNGEAALREFMTKDLLNITTRTVFLALAVRND